MVFNGLADLAVTFKSHLDLQQQAWLAKQQQGDGCFAAGTLLRTPGGRKRVEDFQAGDQVLSRAEEDSDGPVAVKVVERVFVRTGRILHLRVQGQVIRTTPEHPFYVRGQGWRQAALLQAGDLLAGLDGEWVAVDEVVDTGEYETVYNVRVADYHTYFVGCQEWGFSVWAHNNRCALLQALHELTGIPIKELENRPGLKELWNSRDTKRLDFDTFKEKLQTSLNLDLPEDVLQGLLVEARRHGNDGRMPTPPKLNLATMNPETWRADTQALYKRIQALQAKGIPGTDQLIRNLFNVSERRGLPWHLERAERYGDKVAAVEQLIFDANGKKVGRVDIVLKDGTMIDTKAWEKTPPDGQVRDLGDQARRFLRNSEGNLLLEFKFKIDPEVAKEIARLQQEFPGRVRATSAAP
jgi:hypothetical protein